MGRYILQRILSFVPVLFFISVIVFAAIRLIPGDPVRTQYGLGTGVSDEVLAETRHRLGLDQSLPVQYVRWVGRALSGDLGCSIRSKQPVLEAVLQRLPATLLLASASVALGSVLALSLGILAAAKRDSLLDRLILGVARLVGLSMPSFALGIILILLLAVELRLFPANGYTNPMEDPLGALRYLILPACTQGLHLMGCLIGPVRQAVGDELDKEYVRVAQAKGLADKTVLRRHILKNAGICIIAVIGWILGYQLAGAVVVETLFSWPGIGRLAFQAITTRDFPLLQGIVLFAGLGFLTINLVVDLSYAWIDPRIRLTRRVGS